MVSVIWKLETLYPLTQLWYSINRKGGGQILTACVSLDHNQMSHSAADLGLLYLPVTLLGVARLKWANNYAMISWIFSSFLALLAEGQNTLCHGVIPVRAAVHSLTFSRLCNKVHIFFILFFCETCTDSCCALFLVISTERISNQILAHSITSYGLKYFDNIWYRHR